MSVPGPLERFDRAALDERLRVAVDAARAAGELLLEYQRRELTVRTKSSATDPVSEADHASEQLVMGRLQEAFADDGLLGEEEQANREGTSGLRWVVDPLDGTVNYLYGLDAWCVSIGCQRVDTGAPVVGVVHHPRAGETFVAVGGGGARLLTADDLDADPADPEVGRRLAVREPDEVARALVSTGFHYDEGVRAAELEMFDVLLPRVRDVRRAGAAALDLAWTAAGRLDGHGEYGLGPWDWMAGVLLVQEAGGTVAITRRTLAGQDHTGVFAGSPKVVEVLLEAFDPPDGPGTAST